MGQGSWKIHVKHGEIELEVEGETEEATRLLFEKVIKRMPQGQFLYKPD